MGAVSSDMEGFRLFFSRIMLRIDLEVLGDGNRVLKQLKYSVEAV